MANQTLQHPLGWLDVVSPDIAATTAFLHKLFGWSETSRIDVEGNDYILLADAGRPVHGAEQIRPDQGSARWTVFVTTTEVHSLVARAEAAGGTIDFPPTVLAQLGIIAMVTDPLGATLGVWQPLDLIPASLESATAPFVVAQLGTSDLGRTSAFLCEVFGWVPIHRSSTTEDEPDSTPLSNTLHDSLRMHTGGAVAELVSSDQGQWIPVFGNARPELNDMAISLGGTVVPVGNDLVRIADPAGAEFLLLGRPGSQLDILPA